MFRPAPTMQSVRARMQGHRAEPDDADSRDPLAASPLMLSPLSVATSPRRLTSDAISVADAPAAPNNAWCCRMDRTGRGNGGAVTTPEELLSRYKWLDHDRAPTPAPFWLRFKEPDVEEAFHRVHVVRARNRQWPIKVSLATFTMGIVANWIGGFTKEPLFTSGTIVVHALLVPLVYMSFGGQLWMWTRSGTPLSTRYYPEIQFALLHLLSVFALFPTFACAVSAYPQPEIDPTCDAFTTEVPAGADPYRVRSPSWFPPSYMVWVCLYGSLHLRCRWYHCAGMLWLMLVGHAGLVAAWVGPNHTVHVAVFTALFAVLFCAMVYDNERGRRERFVLELKLVAALNQAHSAADAQAETLHYVAHELRNPVHGAAATLDEAFQNLDTGTSVAEGKVATAAGLGMLRSDLKVVKLCTDQMSTIVNDVLDIGAIRAGKFAISKSWTDVRDVVRAAASMLEGVAVVPVHVTVGRAVPRELYLDGDRLRQVIINAVSNAASLCKDGEIVVHTRVARSQLNRTRRMLRCEVTDCGPGLRGASEDDLFTPFKTARGPSAVHGPGTGLGLPICRALVVAMGGEVHLVDRGGGEQGAMFWLEVPLQPRPGPGERVHDDSSDAAGYAHVPMVSPAVTDHYDAPASVRRSDDSAEGSSRDSAGGSVAGIDVVAQVEASTRTTALEDVDIDPYPPEYIRASRVHEHVTGPASARTRQAAAVRRTAAARDADGESLASADSAGSAAAAATAAESRAAPKQRRCHVLVVDDSRINRRVAMRMFASLRCNVSLATDGDEIVPALEAAVAAGNPVDAIFTDLNMARISGAEGLAMVQEYFRGGPDTGSSSASSATRHPACPVVLVSAGMDASNISARHGFAATLRKPFTRADASATLARLFPDRVTFTPDVGPRADSHAAAGGGAAASAGSDTR